MTYTLPDHLWPPQRKGLEETICLLDQGRDVCLYGPTGSGKTEQAIQLMKWAISRGRTGIFYANRKLLIGQTAERFGEAGLPYGIRAAEFEDLYDWSAPVQVASAQTEWVRVHQKNIWDPYAAWLVVVDEAHIQKGEMMRTILAAHKARGAKVVLLTATPIGLSGWADELVISGSLQEYRDCKALVPAKVFSIEQPDMSKVKRNKTGEYVIDGKKRMVYTQHIVGNVLEAWKKYNPDARPTMAYWPGVAESVWGTQQFEKLGVRWCHVDATEAYVDGCRAKLSRPVWEDILEQFKDGSIKGLSSRFKLREGIDAPTVYHAIFATPIGSLASYIQTIGRALRYSPETPGNVIVTDHGGNYWRHGSPNIDRDWHGMWGLSEAVVSNMFQNRVKNREGVEPIRCPKCGMERITGFKCPNCGHEHERSVRKVIMESGKIKVREGKILRPKPVRLEPNTQQLWSARVRGCLRSKRATVQKMTFSQIEANFFREYGYYPPRTLKDMPLIASGWHVPPRLVKAEDLRR